MKSSRSGPTGRSPGSWSIGVAVLRSHRPVEREIVKRSDDADGFEVITKRWIVERTLGWLNRCRRRLQGDDPECRRDDQASNDPCDGSTARSRDGFLDLKQA